MATPAAQPGTRAVPPLAFFLVAACAGAPPAAPAAPTAAASPRVELDPALVDEVVSLTQALVRARPENPPGRERAVVELVAARLRAAGIEPELRAFAGEERVNLLAVVPGRRRELPPLLLLGHSDVVPADEAEWSSPPWQGARVGDRVVGRGVVDMLGMVALETLSMVALAQLPTPLERDVVLLVEGDEEGAAAGVRAALRDWPRLTEAFAALTEGGYLLESYLRDGEDIAAIAVAEKGILQVQLSTRGPAGHGSAPQADAAPDRLLRALERVLEREVERRLVPPVEAQLLALGRQRGGLEGALLAAPVLGPALGLEVLEATPQTRALTRDTCALTGLASGSKVNVVPGSASATLDCRLLPGTDPDAFRDRLLAIIDDPRVELRVRASVAPSASNPEHAVVQALAARLKAELPGLVVLPILSRGTTDCAVLRGAGVPCYGLVPVLLESRELDAMHGADEGVRVRELELGLARLVDLALALGGPTDWTD